MAWQRLSVVVAGGQAEALAEALEEAGALSTEIADADAGTPSESAVFAEPGAEAALWPRCRLTALFSTGLVPVGSKAYSVRFSAVRYWRATRWMSAGVTRRTAAR